MGQWIKRAVRLANSSQFRQGEERCIIGGHHIVSEYLQKNRKMIMLGVSKEYLRRHPAGPNGIFLNSKSIQSETIGDQNIPFGVLPDRAFKLITREASPEGVIAEVPLPRPKSISNDRVLILFNLSLPSNVGALIRSAVAFGWSILIVERCTDPFSYSAIRCSMGTAVLGATIERAKVDDLCDILLNNKLSTILATINQESLAKSLNAASITDQSWSPSLSSLTCIDGIKMSRIPSGGIALILGNETLGFAGLSNEIIRSAITVTIDTGEVESLNVAVAGGILMHTFRKSKGITNFLYCRPHKEYGTLLGAVLSPQGRLFQVEYAMEAVKQGAAAVGVASPRHVVLAALKRTPGELAAHQRKLLAIDEHIGVGLAGLTSDARVLTRYMRATALASRMDMARAIPTGRLVADIADKAQKLTHEYGGRPFGVGLLVAGYDQETGAHLYEFSPSGNYFEFKAMAIGARSQSARTYFDKNVDNLDGCSKDELILHALRALRDTLPPDAPPLTGLNTAIGFVGEDTPFSVVEEEEAVQVWLDKLPPPPERPSGAGDSGVGVGVGGDSGAGGGGSSGEMQI